MVNSYKGKEDNMYKIHIQNQSEPKYLNGDEFITFGNNWFNGLRQVKFLESGDNVLISGWWYTVESIEAL